MAGISLKPGGPRESSARHLEVRGKFDELWREAQVKMGAQKGKVLYGGRHLQNLITALRRAEHGRERPQATANDALFLVKSWGVPDGDLEHYAVDKEKASARLAPRVAGVAERQAARVNTCARGRAQGEGRKARAQARA